MPNTNDIEKNSSGKLGEVVVWKSSASVESEEMTIESYLSGLTDYAINDNAIAVIRVKRNVPSGADVSTLDKKTLDLCSADLYMWCASTPSIRGSVEDANGTWKHKEGGSQTSAYDKRLLRQMAMDIYKLYGENVARSRIRINSMGIGIWRK